MATDDDLLALRDMIDLGAQLSDVQRLLAEGPSLNSSAVKAVAIAAEEALQRARDALFELHPRLVELERAELLEAS